MEKGREQEIEEEEEKKNMQEGQIKKEKDFIVALMYGLYCIVVDTLKSTPLFLGLVWEQDNLFDYYTPEPTVKTKLAWMVAAATCFCWLRYSRSLCCRGEFNTERENERDLPYTEKERELYNMLMKTG